jgi:hypothetical protein
MLATAPMGCSKHPSWHRAACFARQWRQSDASAHRDLADMEAGSREVAIVMMPTHAPSLVTAADPHRVAARSPHGAAACPWAGARTCAWGREHPGSRAARRRWARCRLRLVRLGWTCLRPGACARPAGRSRHQAHSPDTAPANDARLENPCHGAPGQGPACPGALIDKPARPGNCTRLGIGLTRPGLHTFAL